MARDPLRAAPYDRASRGLPIVAEDARRAPCQSYLFTSESVSEGHPDKVCDRISDTVVDAYLAAMPEARVACETLATTNRVVIAGEVRGPASITDRASSPM